MSFKVVVEEEIKTVAVFCVRCSAKFGSATPMSLCHRDEAEGMAVISGEGVGGIMGNLFVCPECDQRVLLVEVTP